MIPAATNSVVVSLSDADGFANTQTVNRPLEGSFSTITFSELPVKQLTVNIAAYPQADAQGVAVATGQSVVDIIANETATVTVKLNSTIDHLSISPTDPTINIDQTVDLGVAAADADGNTVLLTAGKISWASSDASVATVDSATGLVTALHDGTATITVTDAESLQTATTLVTVRKRPTLALTADSTAIPLRREGDAALDRDGRGYRGVQQFRRHHYQRHGGRLLVNGEDLYAHCQRPRWTGQRIRDGDGGRRECGHHARARTRCPCRNSPPTR